jgi:hypothetical protein
MNTNIEKNNYHLQIAFLAIPISFSHVRSLDAKSLCFIMFDAFPFLSSHVKITKPMTCFIWLVVSTPLKNMKVNGKDDIPYIMDIYGPWKLKKNMFETTNQVTTVYYPILTPNNPY